MHKGDEGIPGKGVHYYFDFLADSITDEESFDNRKMADMKSTETPDQSPSTASSPTPDAFLYETKFIVLSFLNHLTREDGHRPRSSSENKVRQIAQHWKARSLPSSPPKKKKKFKTSKERKAFSSDESLNLHLKPKSLSNERNDEKKVQVAQKSNKPPLTVRHSFPSHSPTVDSPDSIASPSPSLPARISLYQRSISDASSHDGGSYVSDADDELDTSQGSTNSSLRGSRSSEYFKASTHHLHVSRLSTVPSESEPEPEQQETSFMYSPSEYNEGLPIDIEGISFEMSPEIEEKLSNSGWLPRNSADKLGLSKDRGISNGGEDVVDGHTDSDISDLESDEIGEKGDDDEEEEEKDDEEDKLGEAAGGRDFASGSFASSRSLDRSRLFLDLSHRSTPNQSQVDSVMASLREEIQDEMNSLESEMDEAYRSRSQQLPFFPPPAAPPTPHTEAAEILARIGDDIVRNQEMMPRVQSAVGQLFSTGSSSITYEVFRDVARSIVDDNIPGWRQVALLLVYSQSVTLKMMAAGGTNVGNIVDYSVKLLADLAADFIIKQGGWNAVTTTESSSSCRTTPDPSTHLTNPLNTASITVSSTATHRHSTPNTVVDEVSTSVTAATTRVVFTQTSLPADLLGADPPDRPEGTKADKDRAKPESNGTVSVDSSGDRGGNSVSSWWPSVVLGDSRGSVVRRCTVTIALLSLGVGVAMVFIKR